jgi:hypothetical protein
VCPSRENNGRNFIKWDLERGSEVMKPASHKQDVKRQIVKGRQHNLRMIIQYSSRNTGTTQVAKMKKLKYRLHVHVYTQQ